jgi:hypothetical protein
MHQDWRLLTSHRDDVLAKGMGNAGLTDPTAANEVRQFTPKVPKGSPPLGRDPQSLVQSVFLQAS